MLSAASPILLTSTGRWSTMQRDGVKERIISQWLEKAEQDLKAAEALASGETFLYFPACFHAQQAVEKFLKALLTDLQVEFPKTHSIEYLIQLLKPHFPALPPVLLDAMDLSHFAVETRYPGDLPEPGREETLEAIQIAIKVKERVLEILGR
ncbi:MAG TPA: DNA-binding protein [Synergistaceae bacterium]|nr:DNA-binding protein [Synergistaceae bacterium]